MLGESTTIKNLASFSLIHKSDAQDFKVEILVNLVSL